MLEFKNSYIDGEELVLSIRESLDYLYLMGIECSLDFNINGEISVKSVGYIYDFFEKCVIRFYDLPVAILVHVFENNQCIHIVIESDVKLTNDQDFDKRLVKSFPSCVIKNNDGVTYYSLVIPYEGV